MLRPSLYPKTMSPLFQSVRRACLLIPVLASVFLSATTSQAQEKPFVVSAEKNFSLTWRGRTIIAEDELAAIPANPLKNPEGYRSEQCGSQTIHNTWKVANPRRELTYRREVASDGNSVELTTQFRVPAYYFDDKPKDLQSFYLLRIPLKVLDGLQYEAVVRRASRISTVKGTIKAGIAPDISGQTLFITFTDPAGHSLSFDFGPSGVTSFDRNTSATALPESWWSNGDKNELRFSVGRLQATTYPYNGVYNGKVRIDESSFSQFRQRHAHHMYNYYMELPPLRQLQFGSGQVQTEWLAVDEGNMPEQKALQRPRDNWIAAANRAYTKANGFGWKDISGIALEGDASRGVLHARAKGNAPRSFIIDVPQPGIYIFTVRTAAGQSAVGPFEISAAGQSAVTNTSVAPGEVKTFNFARNLPPGPVEIDFSGDWAVSTIAVQILIHQDEDFTFTRGLWLAQDVPTPTALYSIERRPVPAAASAQGNFQPEANKAPQSAPPIVSQIDFKTDNPATAWRWASSIAALGPGNWGSFYEFETEEEINRRLDELQKLGYTAILLNGMLIRHAYPEEHPRIQQVVQRVAALAHQRGMKVLDHFDVTVLPNLNASFQLMLENIDWTLRDVRNGQVSRGFCLNNPNFQRHFYDWMNNYVKATGIDGIMLDEITFHKAIYCGCQYCRDKFQRDTGLILPLDETSPDLANSQSRLWKQWQLWRTRAQADFCTELMQQLQRINPDFVWMKYGAPSVFLKPVAAADTGSRLSEATRFSNFLGIESLTNNAYATHRSGRAISAVFNSLTAEEHIPGFNLIYHNHQPVFAYSGWALNNMYGHRSWSVQGNRAIEEDSHRYIDWKDNMDARHATQLTDVAVLLSRNTRDLSPGAATHWEKLLGFCEQLGDLHVPYRVLLDRDLNTKNLQQFQLLILPDITALSDEELAVIRRYIEAGGNVLATGATGTQDALGFARPHWPLGEWLGLGSGGTEFKADALEGVLAEGKSLRFADTMPEVTLTANAGTTILLQGKKGNTNTVAVAQKQIGKGLFIWCAPRLGAMNFEGYARVGETWKYRPHTDALALLGRIVARLRDDKPSFQAVQISTNVGVTIYRQSKPGENPVTYVHLFNGTGATLKPGDKIPGEAPANPFPRLADNLVFEIDLPGAKAPAADFVSPDFAGSRNVTLQPLTGQRYRVIIPPGTLEAYGMVRLRQ